jgi:hypothetical protein
LWSVLEARTNRAENFFNLDSASVCLVVDHNARVDAGAIVLVVVHLIINHLNRQVFRIENGVSRVLVVVNVN